LRADCAQKFLRAFHPYHEQNTGASPLSYATTPPLLTKCVPQVLSYTEAVFGNPYNIAF